MANYEGTARSNYFAVKDVVAFEELCAKWELDIIRTSRKVEEKEENGLVLPTAEDREILYGFICDNGSIPSYAENEILDENGHISIVELDFNDFLEELAEVIKPGWVAILMEAGAEKARYINGLSVAVNSSGETRIINLGDIYGLAQEMGDHVTNAEY